MNRPAELPLLSPPRPAWRLELWRRIRHQLLLKVAGISAFMWLFFQGYFYTLRHPAYPVLEMPLTALDRWIPFEPAAFAAYVSLWFYVGVPPGLMLRWREYLVYGLWATALCAIGLVIFHFWPTAVPPRTMDVSGLPGFALLQGVDAPGNACPSLHVATAMFTAFWIARLLRSVQAPLALRALNWAWFVAIAWSTVAIRQHVVLDAVAGAALGALVATVSLRLSTGVGTGPLR